MLRTALIGYPSTGKTTLFQLMTERARGAARRAREARGDARHRPRARPAPRRRSRRCTTRASACRPRSSSRTSPGGPSGTGADALLDVAAYRNADALVHVAARVHGPGHPARGGLDRSAARRAGDGRRADPGGPRGRREAARAPGEGPEEDAHARSSSGAGHPAPRARPQLENGAPLRALELGDDDRKRLRGFQFLSAKPLLLVLNVDEARSGGRRCGASISAATALDLGVGRVGPLDARRGRVREDRARDRPARAGRRGGVPGGSRPARSPGSTA